MPDYRLTACIVTYRSDIGQIRAALDSLARCTLPHGVHLVDNDSGAEYVAPLRAAVNCPVIESGANKGFGYGHNIGWRQAPPADYHLVLNPDVVMHEGALEAMVQRMDDDPSIGLLVPQLRYPDGRLQPLNKRLPSVFDLFARRFLPAAMQRLPVIRKKMERYIMRDIGYDHEVEVPFASGCCMLFRRDVLEQVGGFDEGYFMYLEDADISIRVRQAGYRVVYTPKAVITHHWARGSHTSGRLFRVMLQSMRYHYRKWGWQWW